MVTVMPSSNTDTGNSAQNLIDYSIIIPAYNEEELLPRTLTALNETMRMVHGYAGEIIVTDNNSSDATAAVAEAHGATVVFEPMNQISRARNCGAASAQGRYLIFVDADTIAPTELIQAAIDSLADGTVCGGGAAVGTTDQVPDRVMRTLSFWNWLAPRLHWAAGSFVYCLRDGWDDVGGFSLDVYASEEIWFSRALRQWGHKRELEFKMLPMHVDTSMRKMQWYTEWQLLVTVARFLLFPWLLRSRKYCRVWYDRPESGNK